MSSPSTSSTHSAESQAFTFPSAQPRQPILPEEFFSSPSPTLSQGHQRSTQIQPSTSSDSTTTTPSVNSDPIDTDLIEDKLPIEDDLQSSPPPRVDDNKHGIPSSTYLSHIAEERDLATSLDALTARDLSIHLFNAFALKRRARSLLSLSRSKPKPLPQDRLGSPTLSNDAALQEVADVKIESPTTAITYEQVGDAGWQPPRVWTAWPMKAEEVPREEKKWEEDDLFANLRDKILDRPSDLLKELLVARVLKVAKERFMARRLEDASQEASPASSEHDERSPSTSQPEITPKSPSSDTNEGPILKPVIMADNDRATSILQPSIQHILSNLDKLLTNLHIARASYAVSKRRTHLHGLDGATSDPTASYADTSLPSSPRKRRRSHSTSKHSHKSPKTEIKDSSSSHNETSYEPRRLKRQRTTSPSHSRPPHNKSRSKSKHRSQSNHTTTRPSKFGLLDWSTVLGIASLSNFPPAAVLRASKRCANLFDQGMKFRVLHEDINGSRDEKIAILPGSLDNPLASTSGSSASDTDTEDSSTPSSEAAATLHVDDFLQPIPHHSWWGKRLKSRSPSRHSHPPQPPHPAEGSEKQKKPERRGRPRKQEWEKKIKTRDPSLPKRPQGRPRKEEWEKKIKTRDPSAPKRPQGRPRKEGGKCGG